MPVSDFGNAGLALDLVKELEHRKHPRRGLDQALVSRGGSHGCLQMESMLASAHPVCSGVPHWSMKTGSKQRSKVAPEIPTLHEMGVVGFDATSWFGFFVPAGTPKEIGRARAQCQN
ncbi:tripartite tricarboxylate transporter substrate-binding protein [Cupriavidus lacunae]|uniref:Uncharacterized protein n=1 Tax=Cupriavidus lacunae TaxID=2666307 RepID=A0A370NLZ2_9BURK|nr:tripartite tricarboxylate transporter substrate-binding protein [Cupriavidus lacunae]RDK06614.1 hypothetical protein DN412_30620 [Cupriavidus lacunae]